MSKSITELTADFQAKHAAHKALIEKGPAMTQEDAQNAQTLVSEMRDLQGTIQSVRRVDQHQAASAEFEQWAQASAGAPLVGGLPGVPSGGAHGSYGNGVSILSIEPDGHMVIERNRRGTEILNFDRNGQPDKAFKAGAFNKCREAEYGAAYRKMMAVGWHGLGNSEQATLQEGQDTAGGYLAPDEMLNRVIQRSPTPTRIASRVTRLTTSRDAISIPKVNYSTDDIYTTGMRATWTGEIPATATTHRVTEPVFGQARIPIYTAMLSIPVTNDLIEDAVVDLMGWLSGKFSETIELLKDNMILNGSGVNQPTGILVNPNGTNQPATVVSGSAAALTGDGLIDLTEAIPEQYDENSVLVFNKTNTGKAIRKLKDGDGRPLVSYGAADNGLAGGRYRQVNGYDYLWSGFMPNVGANTYPIIFGDLLGYYSVDRLGFSIQVLRELYAETNQVLLLGRVRFGGMTAEEWRLRIQKVAAS